MSDDDDDDDDDDNDDMGCASSLPLPYSSSLLSISPSEVWVSNI